MFFEKPITATIPLRYSCRTYLNKPLNPEIRRRLSYFAATELASPFGSPTRFRLVATTEDDSKALRGLGTYGFIKDAAGFVIGATDNGGKSLEDFGYRMEKIILYATDLGLGTCWLGGTFTKSSFALRISLMKDEIIPAVASVGYIAPKIRYMDAKIRQIAQSNQRRPWERLFYRSDFDTPLSEQEAGNYAIPLEMIRLGPSASNRQPWQIVMEEGSFHFYLRRTPNYRNNAYARLLGFADLQRIDMGIAMCHFEFTARELGLDGKWETEEPKIDKPNELIEYSVSWVRKS